MKPVHFCLLVCAFCLLHSCAISTRNTHYWLNENLDDTFTKEQAKWCFISGTNENVSFCSFAIKSYSSAYGFIFPIIPIKNRESKYAFEQSFDRIIEVSNHYLNQNVQLSELVGFQLCEIENKHQCSDISQLSIKPNQTVILKLPQQEEVQVLISVDGHTYHEKLVEFSDKYWSFLTN